MNANTSKVYVAAGTASAKAALLQKSTKPVPLSVRYDGPPPKRPASNSWKWLSAGQLGPISGVPMAADQQL
ncbi:hypothetical protein [Nonomuraea sp. KM90]|uniref:hypothetical protein n=1 Tax=Nonomuraea sp. KM90 TaxID=3457428 RepID=UPI003FCECDBD